VIELVIISPEAPTITILFTCGPSLTWSNSVEIGWLKENQKSDLIMIVCLIMLDAVCSELPCHDLLLR